MVDNTVAGAATIRGTRNVRLKSNRGSIQSGRPTVGVRCSSFADARASAPASMPTTEPSPPREQATHSYSASAPSAFAPLTAASCRALDPHPPSPASLITTGRDPSKVDHRV